MKRNDFYLSVVIPVYQAEDTLQDLHQRLKKVLSRLEKKFEIIFIDDGSNDSSWKILESIYQKDKKNFPLKIIQLARNFGQHNALMCGFFHAQGKYILTMDDDLQNPPEEIPKLLRKIKEGYDVVYGEYIKKKHSRLRNFGSFLVQYLYQKIFAVDGYLTSFRIIKKEVVRNLLNYNRNYTFIDGLIAWQTKKIGYVKVKHLERAKGKSGYTLGKLLVLSLNMLTNFSIFPLQCASIMGFTFSFLGVGIAVYFFLKKLILGIPVTGFASLIISITIFSGVQLITIGLIGEYVGRIHLNINNKPQYIVRKILK